MTSKRQVTTLDELMRSLRNMAAKMTVGTGAEKTMQSASGTGMKVTAARQSRQQTEEVRPWSRIISLILMFPGNSE